MQVTRHHRVVTSRGSGRHTHDAFRMVSFHLSRRNHFSVNFYGGDDGVGVDGLAFQTQASIHAPFSLGFRRAGHEVS